MRPAVKIDDLTESLAMDLPESTAWLDRATGRVWIIDNRVMAVAEGDSLDEEELSDWHEDQLAAARALFSESGRGIKLPTAFDFHEYRHMERFIGTLPESLAANQLWRAIKGRGAFRHFKDTAHRLDLIDAWYTYRDDALRQFMLSWARAHDIPVDESPGHTKM
jgi:Uncharacterised protein family (UPF0158)